MTEKETQQIDRDVLAALKRLPKGISGLKSERSIRKALPDMDDTAVHDSLWRLIKMGEVEPQERRNLSTGYHDYYYRLAPAGRTDKD